MIEFIADAHHMEAVGFDLINVCTEMMSSLDLRNHVYNST